MTVTTENAVQHSATTDRDPTVRDAMGLGTMLAEELDKLRKSLDHIAVDLYGDLGKLQERLDALEEQASKGSRIGWQH